MQIAPNKFIIKPQGGKEQINSVEGDFGEIILNSHIHVDDQDFSNRIAEIIATPLSNVTSAEVGDKLIVGHNVFRKWLDWHGKIEEGNTVVDDLYYAENTAVYGYIKEGETFSTNDWALLDPVPHTDELLIASGFRVDQGILRYPSDSKFPLSLEVGTKVAFKANNFVPIPINDETIYRVRIKDILLYGL
ncbi:MAG: hypothetical protein K0U41_00475 [Gammaproteobacteria bacterium]|nr:hypothetical protein [Gammaproteobacteria bacterium]